MGGVWATGDCAGVLTGRMKEASASTERARRRIGKVLLIENAYGEKA